MEKDQPEDGWDKVLGLWKPAFDAAPPEPGDYEKLASLVNLPSFIDYMLVNLYAGNKDWPDNNYYLAKDKRINQWRFISWDAEFSFYNPAHDALSNLDFVIGSPLQDLLRHALKFPAFREALNNRLLQLTQPGGAFSPAVASAMWRRRADQAALGLPSEYARWGDTGFDLGTETGIRLGMADWRREQEWQGTYWFPQRHKVVQDQLRARNVFPRVIAPTVETPMGLPLVTVSHPIYLATLFYTLDGTDPRDSTTARLYSSPITVTSPGLLRVVALYDGDASPVVTRDFRDAAEPLGVYFSEIHYAPTNTRSEFVELVNRSSAERDLTGVSLSGAVRYSFPAGSKLAPGARLALVRSAPSFSATFPGAAWAGVYNGNLADEGESLELWSASRGILDSIRYRPHEPWPANDGQSLNRVDYNLNGPVAWTSAAPTPAPASVAARMQLPSALRSFAMAIEPSELGLALVFPGEPGHRYAIESATSLEGPWTQEAILDGPARPGELRREFPQIGSCHFFRVRRWQIADR
jgi:hypothetical protein